jgi:hypothetical protein
MARQKGFTLIQFPLVSRREAIKECPGLMWYSSIFSLKATAISSIPPLDLDHHLSQ